ARAVGPARLPAATAAARAVVPRCLVLLLVRLVFATLVVRFVGFGAGVRVVVGILFGVAFVLVLLVPRADLAVSLGAGIVLLLVLPALHFPAALRLRLGLAAGAGLLFFLPGRLPRRLLLLFAERLELELLSADRRFQQHAAGRVRERGGALLEVRRRGGAG